MAFYLEFDGVDDYISIPDQTIMGRTQLAIECKFSLLTTPSNYQTILTVLGRLSNDQASITLKTAGNDDRLDFSYRPLFSGGRARIILGSGRSLLSQGGVHTLRIERDGNLVSLFLDGQLVGTGTTSDVASLASTTIGSRGDAGEFNAGYYYVKGWDSPSEGNLLFNYDPTASLDQGELVDTAGGNNGTPVNFPTNFNDALIFYDDGGGAVTQPVVSEFSGTATVNALASSQAEKRITASGDSLVTTTTTSSASKRVQLSGQSSVTTSSVSLFEKRGLFSGDATVNLTSEAYASKITELSGDAKVNVVVSGTLIAGDAEIYVFSGGALIKASASGQVLKVGLVSGQSTTLASASGQASKVARVEGNATVTASTQSAISKIASVFGEAISHITASAIAVKRVVVSGASTVITTVYGQFFNTESNVETYQTIVQGHVRANPEIEGTVKPTTIQGRVK